MKHRLFYTDVEISEAEYRARKSGFMPYAYDEFDDALGKARQIKEHGGIPWEIELSDGNSIGRSEIARILRKRSAELVGRPKVY